GTGGCTATGTGGGTAGHRWGHCWERVGGGLVGALLGGTCGCHCWAPIIRGTDHQCPDDRVRKVQPRTGTCIFPVDQRVIGHR
ncbi:unnamed protein product, partial [Staurois parvus]